MLAADRFYFETKSFADDLAGRERDELGFLTCAVNRVEP